MRRERSRDGERLASSGRILIRRGEIIQRKEMSGAEGSRDRITEMTQTRQWEDLKVFFCRKENLTMRDLSSRGWAFFELGSFREALNDFEEAVDRCLQCSISPIDNEFNLFKKLGIRCCKTYLKLAEFDRAIELASTIQEKLQPIDDVVYKSYEEIKTTASRCIKFREQSMEDRKEELKDFVTLHDDQEQRGLQKTHYYLVSKDWILNWKDWCEKEDGPYPGPIDNSSLLVDTSTLPYPLRRATEDNEDYTNQLVKPNIKESSQFYMFNKQTYSFLEKRYGARHVIKRFAIEDEDRPDVLFLDIHLKLVRVLMPFFNHIGQDWQKKFVISISRKESIASLQDRIAETVKLSPAAKGLRFQVTFWKLGSLETEENLIRGLEAGEKKIRIEAKMLSRGDILDECELLPQDVILAEVKHPGKESNFVAVYSEKKPAAGIPQILTSSQEDSKDESLAENGTIVDLGFLKKKLSFNSYSGSNGLKNIGNTCFLNSALQCMSNTEPLTKFFLTKAFAKHLNQKNKLGTGGQLAMAYYKLMHELWNDKGSVAPWEVKKEVARKAKQFTGYNQQDSSEFLNFLIDTLHEDLNLIKDKPYIEAKDSNGRPDDVVGEEYWNNFLRRNKSVLVALMYGQLKSRLNCLTCGRVSNTFDPFAILSLPIPVTLEIQFLFAKSNGEIVSITSHITDRSSFLDLIETCKKFEKKLNFAKPEHILAAAVAGEHVVQLFDSTDTIYGHKSVLSNAQLVCYDLQEPVTSDLPLLEVASFSGAKSEQIYPRMFPLNLKDTMRDLREKVYRVQQRMMAASKEGGLREMEYEEHFTLEGERRDPEMYEVRLLETIKASKSFWSKGYFCSLTEIKKGVDPRTGIPLSLLKDEKMTAGELLVTLQKKVDKRARKISLMAQWPVRSKRLAGEAKMEFMSDRETGEKSKISLRDCLNAFRTEETLDGDDKWYCSRCKEHKKALKKLDLFRLPPILVVQLKRFRQRNRSSYFWGSSCEKNGKQINFPLDKLDLKEFVIPGSPQLGDPKSCVYDLYGVVHHMGSLYGGHYVASAKNFVSGDWLNYDDSYVSRIRGADQVVSPSAYVLFYKRRHLNFQ